MDIFKHDNWSHYKNPMTDDDFYFFRFNCFDILESVKKELSTDFRVSTRNIELISDA